MKILKQLAFVPAIAFVAVAGLSAPQAKAAELVAAPQIAVAQPLAAPVYYRYHGHRYSYFYRGKYYNHRARHNGAWSYY